jgi:hypothetical protein
MRDWHTGRGARCERRRIQGRRSLSSLFVGPPKRRAFSRSGVRHVPLVASCRRCGWNYWRRQGVTPIDQAAAAEHVLSAGRAMAQRVVVRGLA